MTRTMTPVNSDGRNLGVQDPVAAEIPSSRGKENVTNFSGEDRGQPSAGVGRIVNRHLRTQPILRR